MNWNVIHSFIMIYVDGLVAFQLFAEVLLNLILDRCFWCAVFWGVESPLVLCLFTFWSIIWLSEIPNWNWSICLFFPCAVCFLGGGVLIMVLLCGDGLFVCVAVFFYFINVIFFHRSNSKGTKI